MKLMNFIKHFLPDAVELIIWIVFVYLFLTVSYGATPRQAAVIGTYAWTVQGSTDLKTWTPVTTVYSPLAACKISLGSTNGAAAILKSYNNVQFYRLMR